MQRIHPARRAPTLRACLAIALPTIAFASSLLAQRSAEDTVLRRRIQLGVTLAEVPDSLRERGAPAGARVLAVLPGSPGAAAGLTTGDILTRIGSTPVPDVATSLAVLRTLRTGDTVPLDVARSGRTLHLGFVGRERPREASPEFVVEYRAVSAPGGRRRVIVTHPRDEARHPAVLLVGGIGCYSIDAPSGESAYRDLMYHLTREGFTTVRVEKLGVGDSDGSDCLATDFDTELAGYRATLDAMRSYPSVDPRAILLFGHSIGGIEAPLLAASDSLGPPIRGIAVLSTVGIAWYEYELANLRRQLVLQRIAPDSLEREMRLKTVCGFHFLVEQEPRTAVIGRDSSCAPFVAYPASDAYMHAVAQHDPASVWRHVTTPVLVLYGTSDFVTSRDEHLALAAAINVMHPGTAAFADVPEIDHFLSRQASMETSMTDPRSGLARPYYGATLEPILDRWLRKTISGV